MPDASTPAQDAAGELRACAQREPACQVVSEQTGNELRQPLGAAVEDCRRVAGIDLACPGLEVTVDAEGCIEPDAFHHTFGASPDTQAVTRYMACVEQVLSLRRYPCAVQSTQSWRETCTE